MRGVHSLDGSWIDALVRQRRLEARSGRLRWGLLPVLPVLGLVPGDLQNRWHLEWGFPAVPATVTSALLELGVAALGVIHLLASTFGGNGILPESTAWLGPLAPLLFLESVVRLKHVAGNQEPIGSVIGLPIAGFVRRSEMGHEVQRPQTRRFDDEAGWLELHSPIHRRDWCPEGVLRYRDQPFELVKVERLGRGWLYHFARAAPDEARPTLRLLPPGDRGDDHRVGRSASKGPGERRFFRVAATTALSCMALGADQERWAAAIGVSPVQLTVLGAGAELVGSLTNLQTGLAGDSALAFVLDLYFLGEGLFRCVLLLISGRPVGSVVGFAIRPLIRNAMKQ